MPVKFNEYSKIISSKCGLRWTFSILSFYRYIIAEIFEYHFTATNGHSECLRLLIGNAEPQNAVDIQDGNGQ